MSFICPLLAPLRRFLPLPYTYPHYTAKLLLSSSMPFQVRPSISTSLSSTGCVLLSIFLFLPPHIFCLTTLFILLFLLHGVGYRPYPSLSYVLRYVPQPFSQLRPPPRIFSFSGFLCGKLSLR